MTSLLPKTLRLTSNAWSSTVRRPHGARLPTSTKAAFHHVAMTLTVIDTTEANSTTVPDFLDLSSLPLVIEEAHCCRVRKVRQSMAPLCLNEFELYQTPKLQPQRRQPLQTIGGLAQELHELCANKNKQINATAANSNLSTAAKDVLSRIPRGRGARGSRRSRSASRSARPKAVPLLGDYVVGSFETRDRKLRTLELMVQKLDSEGSLEFYKASGPEDRLVAVRGSIFESSSVSSSVHTSSSSSSLNSHPLDNLSADLAADDDQPSTGSSSSVSDSDNSSSKVDLDESTSGACKAVQQQPAVEQAEDVSSSQSASQLARLQTASAFVKADLGGAVWSADITSLFPHGLYCSNVLSSGCSLAL